MEIDKGISWALLFLVLLSHFDPENRGSRGRNFKMEGWNNNDWMLSAGQNSFTLGETGPLTCIG